MLKLNQQLARIRQRDGISIIEVLTSMAVATVGVFGIMVMIPFAVQQERRGLDNDAANSVGRNAVEDMQIQGYFAADANGNLLRITRSTTTPSSVMHFDPIGAAALEDLTMPPDVMDEDSAGGFTIDRVSGVNSAGDALSVGEANRLCRSLDDIAISEDEDINDGLATPQPKFDTEAGTQSKRQSAGRVSWSMFLVPEKAALTTGEDTSGTPIQIHRLRTFTLVYRDRVPSLLPVGANAEPTLFDVIDPASGTYLSPVNQILIDTGGTVAVPRISGISKDDWIMLINQVPSGGGTYQGAEPPYDAQVMFSRVTRVGIDPNTGNEFVSVEGGPFFFHANTQLVHLQDVVNVFERSVAIED